MQDSGFVTEVHHITGEEGGSTVQNGSTVNITLVVWGSGTGSGRWSGLL